MAVTANSIVTPQTPNRGLVEFIGTTDATLTLKTLYTGGANGSKVQGLIAVNNGATAHNMSVFITNGGTNYQLNTVAVPIQAGNNGTALPVNLMSAANWPGLSVDANGNPFFFLGSASDVLKAQYATAQATSETLTLMTIVEDFCGVAFDEPYNRLWMPGTSILPPNPMHVDINWGNPLSAGLAALFLPAPNGVYVDVVKRRVGVFRGAGPFTLTQTKFGAAYQIGPSTGGVSTGTLTTDPGCQPPTNKLSIAAGAMNPAGGVSNVNATFVQIADSGTTNLFGLYSGSVAGTPRVQMTITIAGVNSNTPASGGAGGDIDTAGAYISTAGSFDGTTARQDYCTSVLGHNTGTISKSGWFVNQQRLMTSDGSTQNPTRVMLWYAFWNRVFTAAELATVTSYIGGLPPNMLRRR